MTVCRCDNHGLFAENETFWYVRYKILYRAGLPDGLSILVLVECVEHLPLVHPQSNVLKLTTLGQLTHLHATYSQSQRNSNVTATETM